MSTLRAAESSPEPARAHVARPWAAWATLVLVATGAPLLLVEGGNIARPIVVIAFLAFVPGAAVVRLVGVTGFALRATLAVAISLGLTGTIAAALAYLHLWSPVAVFLLVSACTSLLAAHELGAVVPTVLYLRRVPAWRLLPQRRAVMAPAVDRQSRRSRLESELAHLVEVIALLDSVRSRAAQEFDQPSDGAEPLRHAITPELVIATVADHFGLTTTELVGRSRSQRLLLPRHLAIYLSRSLTDGTPSEIGRVFSERVPSTVSSSLSKVNRLLREDTGMSALVLDLTDRIIQARDARDGESNDADTQAERLEGAMSSA